MTSLPLISNHLFVAAIGREDCVNVQPTRKEAYFEEPIRQTRAITLEVLDRAKSMAGEPMRLLRVSILTAEG